MNNKYLTKIAEAEQDKIDTLTFDVPLFLRLMEASMDKDISSDVNLHKVLTNIIALSKTKPVMNMEDYARILKTS